MAHAFAPAPAPRHFPERGARTEMPAGLELTAADRAAIAIDPTDLRRTFLLVQITELEGCVRYMGNAHPLREQTRTRLAALRSLLARWDGALGR